MEPILVRQLNNDKYQIVNGHRRFAIQKKLGRTTIPSLIRNLDDNEAAIALVDSNIHRARTKLSEKSRALALKYRAIASQGKRTDKSQTSDRTDQKSKKKDNWARSRIAKDHGMSEAEVGRLISMASLSDDMWFLIDNKYLTKGVGYQLSIIKNKTIEMGIYNWIKKKFFVSKEDSSEEECSVKKIPLNVKDISDLKKHLKKGDSEGNSATEADVFNILEKMSTDKDIFTKEIKEAKSETAPKESSTESMGVFLSADELSDLFPDNKDYSEIKDMILKIMKKQNSGYN